MIRLSILEEKLLLIVRISGILFFRRILKKSGKMHLEIVVHYKEIVIPDKYIKIEDNVFKSCASLESVKGGEAIEKIGFSVYEDCYSLKKLYLYPSLKFINESSERPFLKNTDNVTIYLTKDLYAYDIAGAYGLKYTVMKTRDWDTVKGKEYI